eukprot:Protomagalhaensia_wolfi_Nauph_80__1182@NODE_169_length_3347_cov_534_512696_g127_i0_p3_GENE_NODE_169_length_3347_cov_534_512696_g127_i0NODE_169_length_3347_cov_534_512696_g127_i0_p3_ORF_typecomplete_len227_score30_62ASF1_hist_chap/PF04729_13/1_1e55_NODE_169_length_3347_cov_534_512696_g127_i011511831
MAWVNVTNVSVKCPNPAPLTADFSFEVSFQCLQDLTLPIVWRLVYVGDAGDKTKDQELESVELGPLKKGALKFTFESDPPDFTKIDPDNTWGTTVILLEGTYRNQDFIRIGWYIHNVYIDPSLQDDPPDVPIMEKMVRYIAVGEPRVTRFSINWSGETVSSMLGAAVLGQIQAQGPPQATEPAETGSESAVMEDHMQDIMEQSCSAQCAEPTVAHFDGASADVEMC